MQGFFIAASHRNLSANDQPTWPHLAVRISLTQAEQAVLLIDATGAWRNFRAYRIAMTKACGSLLVQINRRQLLQ
jgi:hypothetical protein